jgi:hypothetical protein
MPDIKVFNDANGTRLIEAKGQPPRAMGCWAPKPHCALPGIEQLAAGILPQSQWQELTLGQFACEVQDQGQTSSCFPAGTHIRMEDGSERKIEDVRLLDKVLTAEGNIGTVTRLMVRHEPNALLRLCLWGHRHLRMTAEHPVLTKRGYVPACELRVSKARWHGGEECDWVAMPRYAPQLRTSIHVDDHVDTYRTFIRRERVSKIHSVSSRGTVLITKYPLPDFFTLTPGVGRIFGLFLAEGSTTSTYVMWTFNIKEKETLAAELIDLLKAEFGIEGRLRTRPNNTCNVQVHGTGWARLFEALFKTGAGRKRIPSDIASGPKDFLEALFTGWLDGDGHARRNGIGGVSISRDLALGMFDIAHALGKLPAISRREGKPNKGALVRQASWEVHCQNDPPEKVFRSQQDDKHVWRRMAGIEMEEFSGPVYNMEVEGDNSYVAEGIGVHNCTGFGTRTLMRRFRLLSGQTMPPTDFSPWGIYEMVNHGADGGADPEEVMTALIKRGCPLMGSLTTGGVPDKLFLAPSIDGQKAVWDTAARYKLAQAYSFRTWDGLCTALTLGKNCGLGIPVRSDFMHGKLDDEGVVPWTGQMLGWHWVEVHSLEKSKKYGWKARMQNQWGMWGDKGFAYIVEQHLDPTMSLGFAPEAQVDDPNVDTSDFPAVTG